MSDIAKSNMKSSSPVSGQDGEDGVELDSGVLVNLNADAAMALFQEAERDGEVLELVDEVKLRWKIDLRVMPLLVITYMLQSIDKSTLGYASVFDLQKETGLVGTQYSWLGAIFYLGYFVAEYPLNLLLQRLPVGTFMSITVIIWGAVLMCHAACNNFATLATARTFLGVFEAAVNPATILIISMWYKRSEAAFRMGIWIGSCGIAYIIAGISAYGIGHITGSLDSFRLIFLIFGAITFAWGVVLLLFLPNSPVTAKFLSKAERMTALERIKENGTGVGNKTFKKYQFIEAISDPKTWLLFIFAVASNSPNGGLTTFQGLIIKGMGFSSLNSTLVQMPYGATIFIFTLLATYISSAYKNMRLIMMLVCLVPFLIGIIGLWVLPKSNPYGRLVCLWIGFAYVATWTLSMTVAAANTSGHTKKITTNAFLLMGYCLGNFIGPFFFVTAQAPIYDLGVGMMFFCIGVQVISICTLWALLYKRNAERAAGWVGNEKLAAKNGFMDLTDLENEQFMYAY